MRGERMRKQPHEASRRNDKIRPPKNEQVATVETREPWKQVHELGVDLCKQQESAGTSQDNCRFSVGVVAYRVRAWGCWPYLSYRVVQYAQLLQDPRSKISICRVLASSLKTKGRRPLLKKKGNVKNVVISWEQLVVVVVVQREAEVIAVRSWSWSGRANGVLSPVISWYCELVRGSRCCYKITRIDVRGGVRQDWRRLASDGVRGVSRGVRCESRGGVVETAGA